MLATPTQIVKQRAEQDCYLCSLTMALGLTYEQISERLGLEFVSRINEKGCYSDDVDLLYKKLGLVRGLDYYSVYRHDPAIQPRYGASAEFARSILWGRRALIQVKSLNHEGSFHIVYWDGFDMFDPSNKLLHSWDTLEPMYITVFNERGPFFKDRK